MRFAIIFAILLIGAAFAHPDQQRIKRQAQVESSGASGEGSAEVASSGEASGESSGQASGEASGESSGQASGEASGESSGQASGEASGESSGQASGESSGEASGEASGESSGEASGDESGEGSGEEDGSVPVDALTIQQLETLNTYAQQVHAESQKLIHQANLVITEMTALSANAQNLGILSNIVATNSQTVLANAKASLNTNNTTEPGVPAPGSCTNSAVCYNDKGCGNGGKCIGAFAGTCSCNSCVYGWPCQEDSGCGGFQGACNTNTSTCDCFAAYTKHNFTLTEALTNFCNVATCDGTNNEEDCFGLTCNYGFCVC